MISRAIFEEVFSSMEEWPLDGSLLTVDSLKEDFPQIAKAVDEAVLMLWYTGLIEIDLVTEEISINSICPYETFDEAFFYNLDLWNESFGRQMLDNPDDAGRIKAWLLSAKISDIREKHLVSLFVLIFKNVDKPYVQKMFSEIKAAIAKDRDCPDNDEMFAGQLEKEVLLCLYLFRRGAMPEAEMGIVKESFILSFLAQIYKMPEIKRALNSLCSKEVLEKLQETEEATYIVRQDLSHIKKRFKCILRNKTAVSNSCPMNARMQKF